MNILIIGSGGREHALAWKIKQGKKTANIYIAPGNAGTAALGNNLNIQVNEFEKIKNAVLEYQISMVIVGPEDPLVNGITDYFLNDPFLCKVHIIGPDKQGALLEGSKEFAKKFMIKYGIPTARYKSFTIDELLDGYAFIDELVPPYVLKADGLAAGKGVVILNDKNDAKNELAEMLSGKFGDASRKIVIEEFLSGIELSVFVLTDGKSYQVLPEAKDYKRIGEGDTGLNTGGMGAISPVPFANKAFMEKVEERIIIPTISGLKQENILYKGFIFLGLINVNDEPYVIEYNVRMGDPETEVVIPRIENDLIDLLLACSEQKLHETKLKIASNACATVVLTSKGYPGEYEKGKKIEIASSPKDVLVFHSGTKNVENTNITNGGRVLAISSYGKTIKDALKKSYAMIEQINFEGKTFRRDIGFDFKITE
jgi:phosphoribosylamine--glycine ligase